MKTLAKDLLQEIDELRIKLQEAEDTLIAIRTGEVDALVINGTAGEQIFTLKGSDRPYRAIVEAMSEAAVTLSSDGMVLYGNSRFAQLVGNALDRVIGSSFEEYLDTDNQRRFYSLLARQEQARTELSLQSADGSSVPVYLSLSRVSMDNCEAICLVATDLTEQKRQETALVQERRRAEEKLRENDRLATMGMTATALAHEIANPLQWIYTTVQLMQRDLAQMKDNEFAMSWQRPLAEIYEEINRLSTLLQDFRSLARPSQLNLSQIHLGDLCAEVEKIVFVAPLDKNFRIEHRIAPEAQTLVCDGEKLRQVLLNLCKNALDAMPSGGTLTVSAEPQAQHMIIEISDTGVGVPDDIDIFEPFITTKDKGTGLGLMVVRQIVAAHGGAISYHSKPGQGTTFRLSLPVSAPPSKS